MEWTPIDQGWRIEAEGLRIHVAASGAAAGDAPPLGVLHVTQGELDLARAIVDLERREIVQSIGSSELVARLLAEMPEDIRQRLLTARGERIDLERRLPAARARSANTVGSSPLYADGRGASIMELGTSFHTAIAHRGRTYVVERSICPRPDCDCQELFLHVEGADRSGVSALLHLDTGDIDHRRAWGVPEGVADELIDALLAQHPDLRQRAARDYADLKELARRSERKATRKPSKNAPCPCGSGRRYKACCGR